MSPAPADTPAPLNANLDAQIRLWTDDALRPTGLEHERLAGVILPFRIGWQEYGHLPAWNPFMGSGQPLFNNAFNDLFNPVHSLPLLLAGAVAGSKIALLIGLLLAGVNMALLARALDMSHFGALLAAGLWLMSGQIAGKFAAGHFQLGLSLSWPPLVLAALLWTTRSRNRAAPVAFGAAFALLFYAGNITYTLHTILWSAALAAYALWKRRAERRQTVGRLTLAALFAFGFSALLFIPVWQTRAFISHEGQQFTPEGGLQGAYSLAQAVANLLTRWSEWSALENAPTLMSRAVDYAYIGLPAVLLALVAVVLIAIPRFRRHLSADRAGEWGILLALTLLMLIWGAGDSPVIAGLYRNIPLLAEFRFVGRALAFAALGCILLAAFVLDRLWQTTNIRLRTPVAAISAAAVAGLWLYTLAYSTASTSGRLALVGNNFNLLQAFDPLRWQTLPQTIDALFVLVGVVGAGVFLSVRSAPLLRRGLAALLLALCLWMLNDVLHTNSALYTFEPVTDVQPALWDALHTWDDSPFPAVNLPFSPRAYAATTAHIRNWGLNEGWEAAALPDTIFAPKSGLPDIPRWALVPLSAQDDWAQILAREFVRNYGYTARDCLTAAGLTNEVCAASDLPAVAIYERPQALPYAFVVPLSRLQTDPAGLTAADVRTVPVLEHRMDSLTLQVQPSTEGEPLVLIVQETNFPGWQASADDQRVTVQTAPTGYLINNHLQGFVALRLPPGSQRVRLWFEAPGLTAGVAVFALTLLAALGYALTLRAFVGTRRTSCLLGVLRGKQDTARAVSLRKNPRP
jgi:hypothetical protein